MARKSLYLCIADGSVKVHLVQEHCNSNGVTVMEAQANVRALALGRHALPQRAARRVARAYLERVVTR